MAQRLGAIGIDPVRPLVLAVGSERGWTQRECELLGGSGFELASLGSRILKTETAVEAAVVLALAKLGRI
jgi:RsmE family RNA methyltransferase